MRFLSVSSHSKLLLFGEHAAVYGHPAVGIPLLGHGLHLSFSPASEYHFPQLLFERSLEDFFIFLEKTWNLPGHFLRGTYRLESSMALSVGFGSSAVLTTSLARLAFSLRQENPPVEELWSWAHRAEKWFHGNPSGVDTALVSLEAAAFFWPQKGNLPRYDLLPESSFVLLVGAFPRFRSTKDLVAQLAKRLQREKKLHALLKKLGLLAQKAVHSWGNASVLGNLANEAHSCLKSLELSSTPLDNLLSYGIMNTRAKGGKLSGAGAGGAFFWIFENLKDAEDALGLLNAYIKREGLVLVKDLFIYPASQSFHASSSTCLSKEGRG